MGTFFKDLARVIGALLGLFGAFCIIMGGSRILQGWANVVDVLAVFLGMALIAVAIYGFAVRGATAHPPEPDDGW